MKSNFCYCLPHHTFNTRITRLPPLSSPFFFRHCFLIDGRSLNSCSTCWRRARITCRARSSQQTPTFFWGRWCQWEFPPLPLPFPFLLPLSAFLFFNFFTFCFIFCFIFYVLIYTSYTFRWAAIQQGVWVLSKRKITQPHCHTYKYTRLHTHTCVCTCKGATLREVAGVCAKTINSQENTLRLL